MKKIILGIFIICGLQLPALAATYNCEVQEISALSLKRSNEFLFPTRGDYNDANGLAYVCGHRGTDGCDSGTGILIFGEHYWENNRYDEMEAYQCSTGGANAWVQQPVSYIPTCTNTNGMTKVYTQGDYDYYCVKYVKLHTDNARCIGSLRDSNSICRKPHQDQPTQPAQSPQPTPQEQQCETKTMNNMKVGQSFTQVQKDTCLTEKATISDDHGIEFTMTCNADLTLTCKATKCDDGYTLNPSTGKCTKNNNNGGGGTETNSCEQKRCSELDGSKWNECVACCYVTEEVANWNGSTCICAQNPDSNKFVPNRNPRNGGICIPQQSGGTPPPVEPEPAPEPAYECDSEIMAQLMTWQAQYASNATISAQIMLIIQYCEDDDPNENTFNVMYSQLVALINQENAAAQLTQQQNASRRRIEGAVSDIDSVVSTLDRSKWKNAEGGFNTSRLLSDSIAGVVLGTAGGLITSHVVKKNQVKGGFEDIQCTVGGQVVAGWGDEFQVGIQ